MGRGTGKFVAGVAVGAAVGAGLGVLFAPKSGKETREELKQKNLFNTSKKQIINIMDNIKSKSIKKQRKKKEKNLLKMILPMNLRNQHLKSLSMMILKMILKINIRLITNL